MAGSRPPGSGTKGPLMGGCSHDSWLGSASLQENGPNADSINCQPCTRAVGDFFLMLMNVFR